MAASSTSLQVPASARRQRNPSSTLPDPPPGPEPDQTATNLDMNSRGIKRKLTNSSAKLPSSIAGLAKSGSNHDDQPPGPKRTKTGQRTTTRSVGSLALRSEVARRMYRLQEGNLVFEKREGFMPSAENDFKFKYDSPASGRTAAELDTLFALPARAPLEIQNKYMRLSYDRFGEPPARGKSGVEY